MHQARAYALTKGIPCAVEEFEKPLKGEVGEEPVSDGLDAAIGIATAVVLGSIIWGLIVLGALVLQ